MLANSALRTTQVLYEKPISLLARERYDRSFDRGLLEQARRELLTDDRAPAGGFRCGFLLGVEADAASHPACLELAETVRSRLLADTERRHELEFRFSFYKLAEGVPPSADQGPLFEGPHLDSHPALTDSTELLRLLVNLSEYPRRFLYCCVDRSALSARGIPCGRQEFLPIQLPPRIETRVIEIPGRTDGSVHALRFLASAIPHVGLNDPPEHFLVSFEALSDQGLAL